MQLSQVATLPVSPHQRCHIVAAGVYFYPQRCSSIALSENDCFSFVIVTVETVPRPPPPEGNTWGRFRCQTHLELLFHSQISPWRKEVSIGWGDETLLAPRWLLSVDVMDDLEQHNLSRKLTSRPGVVTESTLTCFVGSDRLIHINRNHIQPCEALYLLHLLGVMLYSFITVLNLLAPSVEFKYIHQMCLNFRVSVSLSIVNSRV